MISCGIIWLGGGHLDNLEYVYLTKLDYYCEQTQNTFLSPEQIHEPPVAKLTQTHSSDGSSKVIPQGSTV